MTVYALLNDARDGLAKYPISPSREFPDISFRREPPDDELALFGVVRVRETRAPVDDALVVTELPPEREADGHWHQRWQGVPDPERLAAAKEAATEQVMAAGRADWVARMAQLARAYLDAAADIQAATSGAEIRQALATLDATRPLRNR